jgi:HPt (histidine-containing phosphotransfer) domain-containing protein
LRAARLLELIERHISAAENCERRNESNSAGVREENQSSDEVVVEQQRPPLDVDALCKRWGNDRELALTILAKFRSRAPEDLALLRQAFAAGDATEAMRLAHGLKGAAGYVCAERLRKAAARLESICSSDSLDGAADSLNEVQTELERCLSCDPARVARVEA